MVVPLPDLHHFAVEAANIGIELVVAIVAAELLERLGHLALFFGEHIVAPSAAVGQFHLGLDRAVGIDRVAGMNEEVGIALAHGLIDAHAAEGGVDAPALTGGVARPQEADIAGAIGGGAKVPGHRLGERAGDDVLELHAIEDVLACGQTGEIDPRTVVAQLGGIGAAQALRIGKARGGRPVDPHPCRPVGARPDDAAIALHVAALNARRKAGPCPIEGHDRRGLGMGED